MVLAFLSLGGSEIVLIIVAIIFIIGIGNYGRDTQLGYTGSIILAILTSPIVAFLVIYYLKYRAKTTQG